MLSDIMGRLFGERPLNIQPDIDLVEDIVGERFDYAPKARICTPKRYKKILERCGGLHYLPGASTNLEENKIYIVENLEPYRFEFCKGHELGEVMFHQKSRLQKELDEVGILDEKLFVPTLYFREVYKYFSNGRERCHLDPPESEGDYYLCTLIRHGLGQGFSNLVGRMFLLKKFGRQAGYIPGVRYTNINASTIDKMPDSEPKVLSMLGKAATVLGNRNFSRSGLQYFLDIGVDQVPDVGKELAHYYTNCLEPCCQKFNLGLNKH